MPAGGGLFGAGSSSGGNKPKSRKGLFGPSKPTPDGESDGSASSGDESSTAASESSRASAGVGQSGDLPKYVVKQRAIMRQGYETNSKPAKGKPLKIGDVVQALETRQNDTGVLRIRVDGGWVSEKARDGTVLLAKEGDSDPNSDDDSAGSESESESESESSATPQPAKKAPVKKGPPAVPKSKNAPAPKRVTQNTTKITAGDDGDGSSDDDSDGSESESESSAAPQPAKKAPMKKGPPAVPKSKNAPAPTRVTQSTAKSAPRPGTGGLKTETAGDDDDESGDDTDNEKPDELPHYEVKNLAIVREGFEITSKPVAAKLKVGEIIPALELRRNDKGVLRIRVAAGWVSERAGSGQVILEEIRPLDPETEWEQLDGKELTEARSPKAAAEIIASGSQVPPPLEPLVEEGSAEWMVRATSVERAATKSRAVHRSRALKIKRVVRANEFDPFHVEGTQYEDAPVRDGTYCSVDRDLWTSGGFPTWQRLPEKDDTEKGWTEDSYLIYNIAQDSWFHTNSYKPGERGTFDATSPRCLAPAGPMPSESKWAVTIVPKDTEKQPYPSEYSVAVDVSAIHPDFGDSYAKPTGLADLWPLYAQLVEMVQQMGELSHRLTQEQMAKFSADPPTLQPMPSVDEKEKESSEGTAVQEKQTEGRLSIADCYESIIKATPELANLIDGLSAEQPTTSQYELSAVSEFKTNLDKWLTEHESAQTGTRTVEDRSADASPAGVFLKQLRSEWAPMIQEVMQQTNGFVAEWPHGMGLGALSTMCEKFLSSNNGSCPKLVSEFFTEIVQLQTKLQESDERVQKCKAALERQTGRVTRLATLDELLSELVPYDSIPDGVTATLEELLSEFGYGADSDSPMSGDDTTVGRALRCEQAEDNISTLTSAVENDVLNARKDLMLQLTAASEWVQKRLQKLRDIETAASSVQDNVNTEVDASVERYASLANNVNLAVDSFDGEIAAVQMAAKEESLARNRSKNSFQEQTGLMQEENNRLAAEVIERLKKIKSNEDLMRQAEAADRTAEQSHQQVVERYSQNLGALSGCRDEMATFGQILEKSAETAKHVKDLTTSFLSSHEHSVSKNITRDAERVEERRREWDTQHFATYCDAFEPVYHSRVMLQTAALNVECELEPMRQLIKTARDMRDKAGEASLKKKQAELREQKSVLDSDIAAIVAHENDLHSSIAPVLERLQSLREDRDAHLLAVFHKYGFTKAPATEAHLAVAERVKDKATKLVVTQHVTLTTKRLEAEEKRASKISEFMPSYKDEWSDHVSSADGGAPLALTYAPLSKTNDDDDRDRPPPSMHAVEAAAAAELLAKRRQEEEAQQAALEEQKAAEARAEQATKEAAEAAAFEAAVAKAVEKKLAEERAKMEEQVAIAKEQAEQAAAAAAKKAEDDRLAAEAAAEAAKLEKERAAAAAAAAQRAEIAEATAKAEADERKWKLMQQQLDDAAEAAAKKEAEKKAEEEQRVGSRAWMAKQREEARLKAEAKELEQTANESETAAGDESDEPEYE